MADHSSFTGNEDDFGGVVLRYLDGVATTEECELIRTELSTSPEQRRYVVSLCRQHGQLSELLTARQQQTNLTARATGSSTVSRRYMVAVAAAFLLAAGLWAVRNINQRTVVPIARLEQVQGEVYLVEPSGQRIAVAGGQQVVSGQGLQTVGDESYAVVIYDDATRLEIGADSVLTRFIGGPDHNKQVFLTEGYLTADVARQPPDRPMLVSTPQAEVLVVGTRFNLSGAADTTYVETREGKVQVTRKSDGEAIDLGAGDEAAISQQHDLVKSRSLPANENGPRLNIEGQWTAAFSHDGRLIATSHYVGGDVELWDVDTGQRNSVLTPHRARTTALAFAPQNGTLATACADQSVRFFDSATGRLQSILSIQQGAIIDISFSSSGQDLTVLSTSADSEDRVVSVWNLEKQQQRIGSPWPVSAQRWAFSPQGDSLATARQGSRQVIVWDLAAARVTHTLEGVGKNVFSLAFSHSGRTLAINDSSGTVTLRRVTTGEVEGQFTGAGGRIFGMTFSPDDILLATGHQDGVVRVWHIDRQTRTGSSEQVAVLESQPSHIRAVSFTPDGNTLLTRSIRLATPDTRRDGSIQLWEIDTAIKSSRR